MHKYNDELCWNFSIRTGRLLLSSVLGRHDQWFKTLFLPEFRLDLKVSGISTPKCHYLPMDYSWYQRWSLFAIHGLGESHSSLDSQLYILSFTIKLTKYYINFEQNIAVITTMSVALNICQSCSTHRNSTAKTIFFITSSVFEHMWQSTLFSFWTLTKIKPQVEQGGEESLC